MMLSGGGSLRISEEQLRAIGARALARVLDRRSRGSEAEFQLEEDGDETAGEEARWPSSLYSGYLYKQGQAPAYGGDASWKKRFFVLRRDLLFYFSGEPAAVSLYLSNFPYLYLSALPFLPMLLWLEIAFFLREIRGRSSNRGCDENSQKGSPQVRQPAP